MAGGENVIVGQVSRITLHLTCESNDIGGLWTIVIILSSFAKVESHMTYTYRIKVYTNRTILRLKMKDFRNAEQRKVRTVPTIFEQQLTWCGRHETITWYVRGNDNIVIRVHRPAPVEHNILIFIILTGMVQHPRDEIIDALILGRWPLNNTYIRLET